MDMLNGLPENRTDHIQREIVDQLSREKEPVDELQLAALLGKTLLEKNDELELKLRKLQEFAEETLSTNQSLARQLAECKESLQFSNQLCEQLEGKVEDVESSNRYLTKLCEERRSLLKQKSSHLESTEEALTHLKTDYESVREDLARARRESLTLTRDREECGGPRSVRARDSCDGSVNDGVVEVAELRGKAEQEEVSKLRVNVVELSQKLQNSAFQKQRLERQVQEVLGENASLTRSLDRTEAELAELQLRFEELSEAAGHNQEPPTSPPSSVTTPLTPISLTPLRRRNVISSSGRLDSSSVVEDSSPRTVLSDTNGESLFSELDTQYSNLQQSYGDLLHKCTCSASLEHRGRADYPLPCPAMHSDSLASGGGGGGGSGAFKELFEEMFATLKQTAQVADRLIEKRAS